MYKDPERILSSSLLNTSLDSIATSYYNDIVHGIQLSTNTQLIFQLIWYFVIHVLTVIEFFL